MATSPGPTDLEAIELRPGLLVTGTAAAIALVKELMAHTHLADKTDPAEAVRELLEPLHQDRDRLTAIEGLIRLGYQVHLEPPEDPTEGEKFDLRATLDTTINNLRQAHHGGPC